MAQVNLSMDSHGVNTFIDVDHYEMERHRMSPNDSIAETSEHDSVRHGNIDLESNNEVLAPSEDHDNILNAPYLTIAPATNQQIDHSGCQDYESTCSFYRRFNEGFDNFYMSFRKYAIYPCIFFWVVGIAFGVNSLAFDSWRRNIVEYTADGVVGISESVIGAYGIERLDNAKVNDEYFITMRRSLSYENILAEGKCAAGEVQQLTEARLLEELLFRSEGKVGNLDPSDQQNFVALHGKSVYDVMRSGIPMMADAGRVIVIMGIMSYVLFCLMTYFVLRRVIYPNGTISGHVNVTIWYIGSVAWSLSLLLGGIGFVVYVCVSGEPCCINAAGTPKICSLYLSSYYFIIYLFSNALCFVAYILNTRVHGVDGSERDHTAMLLEYVESLVERRCVRFSKPVLSLETRRDPPSRFSTGGLRQVGEWISTCALVDRVMQIQRLDSDQFYSSDVGCRFVRVLESRVCSLTARQLYQVLVAAKQFKAPVEDIVLNELRPQLGDLGSTELLRLPSLVNKGNPSFWACLSQEVNSRGISKGSRPGVHGMLQNALLESYRSHLNRKLM